MPKKPSKPHDEFFKATFSRVKVAREYLQKMLSPALLQVLDLKKLKRVNGSYVSPTLREFFTDVVYECPLKDSELKICISILFEHKSSPEKYPHFQLLRYMLDAWEEQLKQKAPLTPFVPTIIYHGEENWIKKDLPAYFSEQLPADLLPYLPSFDYHFTHVTAMSDEEILSLGKSLLTNAFLMMKHIWEPEFVLQNPRLIFINLDEISSPRAFIFAMLAYFLKNSELAKEKVKHFIEILPKTLNETIMSTYDMLIEEGIEKGLKINQELLAKERMRAEEERVRAEEERVRAEEALRLIDEEHQKTEEERLRLDNVIVYLHNVAQMPIIEIANMTEREITYIEALVLKKNEEE